MTRWNPEPAIVRALRRIDTSDPDACWLWPGSKMTSGYGIVVEAKRNLAVHRVVYEHFVGPIPAGLQLDHRCHNEDADCPGGNTCPHRACCNPGHLEPATNQQNAERGTARLVTCRAGHAFDYHDGRQRVCRKCRNRRWREWKARQA